MESYADLRWFIIVDDVDRASRSTLEFVTGLLAARKDSRLLALSRVAGKGTFFGSNFNFDSEFFSDGSVLLIPENRIHISRSAPSFALLSRLQDKKTNLDELTWREFETLIAELLGLDGYTVQQMRGTKDGGADVIAIKHIEGAGVFKTIWQAKKSGIRRKVGLSVVRELADSRLEHAASKAIIVTSSYLTKGALDRIRRDNYILGKVDRDDLKSWIGRHFGDRDL